jgi:hypothetical protein
VAGMGSDLPAEGLKPLPASWFGDGVVSWGLAWLWVVMGPKHFDIQIFWRLSTASKQTWFPIRSLEIQGHKLAPVFPSSFLEKMTGAALNHLGTAYLRADLLDPSHSRTQWIRTGILRRICMIESFSFLLHWLLEAKNKM